jgi:hypothetical protein
MMLKARFGVPQQTAAAFSRIRYRIETLLLKAAVLGAAAVFSLALQPAFAQHGGGGGHAGGGGGHSSGGSGGHASSGSGGSHASTSGGSARSSAPHVSASAKVQSHVDANSDSAPAARIAFGTAGNRAGLLAFDSRAGAAIPASRRVIPYHVTIGFPPRTPEESAAASPMIAGGSLAAARSGNQPVSYFGDGNEMWSEPVAAASRPSSTSSSPVLASLSSSGATLQHAAVHSAPASAPAAAPRAPVAAPASTHPAPVRAPQGASAAPRSNALRPPSSSFAATAARREAFPRNPRARPRGPVVIVNPMCPFGLWCGGFGYGGFGYGGFGYGAFGLGAFWWPDYSLDGGAAWGDPCAPMWFAGCDAYYDGNGMGADTTQAPPDDSDSISAQKMDDNEHNVWLPPDTPEREQNAVAAEKSLTVLYLKDGSVYAVTDFWVADGKLTYDTSYGAENSIDLEKLDLERTVNANAARGVPFTMKPKPSAQPAPPSTPDTQPRSQPPGADSRQQPAPPAQPQTPQPTAAQPQ